MTSQQIRLNREARRPVLLQKKELEPKVKHNFLVHLECWEEYAAKNLGFEDRPMKASKLITKLTSTDGAER